VLDAPAVWPWGEEEQLSDLKTALEDGFAKHGQYGCAKPTITYAEGGLVYRQNGELPYLFCPPARCCRGSTIRVVESEKIHI
jgi:hypothetical protein